MDGPYRPGGRGQQDKKFHQVVLQAGMSDLCFRIAHAAVILDHQRLPVAYNKPKENKTQVIHPLTSYTLNRWFNDALITFCRSVSSKNGKGLTAPMPPVGPVSLLVYRL